MRLLALLALLLAAPASGQEMPRAPFHTNSLGMRFARVPAGSFDMGQARAPLPKELTRPLSYPTREELERRFPHGDPERLVIDLAHVEAGDFDERPVHRVTISRPFYMGVHEVTNAQYEAFDPGHRELRGKRGFSTEDDDAVVFVSWDEARAFAEWLSEKEGHPYRLPTEAEWEYACRGGTTTPFHTGTALPEAFHKNARRTSFNEPDQDRVPLHVGRTPPNPWGLFDMHGNVEEWVHDWYGPYETAPQTDPVGRETGDFKVTRGGSHGTHLYYLRSANRMGTLPENRHWLVGFRVVLGEMPETPPLPSRPPPLNQRGVAQRSALDIAPGADYSRPYFEGPRPYVKIPEGSTGPLFSHHNHDPGIVECPNGDLLAIWYTTVEERGRELAVAASRLRAGTSEWEEASLFWDVPDRNDHCPALWHDGEGTLYHFNGLSVAGKWEPLAVVMRTSTDSGATWSKGRLIVPEHGYRQMVGEPVFRMGDGAIAFGADAAGGSTIWVSRDGGETWNDPGGNIAGIHAGIVELTDGRLMALGRGQNVDGMMPRSLSSDGGHTWTVSASPFPPIRGGQRAVLLRLNSGPLFFASFARDPFHAPSSTQDERRVAKLFGAVSYDEGETWPVRRIVSSFDGDRAARTFDGAPFRMGPQSSEPKGYLSVTQTSDGVIQLLTSWNHYAFNLPWLEAEAPGGTPGPTARDLVARETLPRAYVGSALPTLSEPGWQLVGGAAAEEGVARVESQGLRITADESGSARWSNERLVDGFASTDIRSGLTAELGVRLSRGSGERGVDLELFARAGTLNVNHYLLTVTADAVRYWYDGAFVTVAEGLDNTDRPHSYRLAVRADTAVQIYRDGVLLATHDADLLISWRTPARGSYLEWGLGSADAEAWVTRVAFDVSGGYQP